MIEKHIELVKNQISFHEYRAGSSKSEHARKKQEALVAGFSDLLKDLIELNGHPVTNGCSSIPDFLKAVLTTADPRKPTSDPAQLLGDLSPNDLEGLPDDVLAKLGLRPSDKQDFLIVDIIKELGGAAIITKILIKMYQRTGEAPERNTLGAKLYRMTAKGLIKSSNLGKGWYCLPEHESASDKNDDEDSSEE